jgi:DNA-binding NtrC family response regulator
MTDNGNKAPRLLVIDDEAIVGKRLAQIFTKMGYTVAAHVDPALALAEAERQPFDIVVTDLKMQGIDGLEVLRRVKKINPATRVIIITGYAEMDTADTAFSEGVFDFIPKPFRLDEIKDAILRAMADRAGEV